MILEPLEANTGANQDIGLVTYIPVRNLWLLMLYASNMYRELGISRHGIEETPDDIPKLVAENLCHRVEHRIKRNLSYGYRSREAELSRVRGRIQFLKTESHRLLDRGKVACRFEELTIDTPRNRYVRSALETISNIVKDEHLSHKCRSLASSLRAMGVVGERPDRSEISIDRFGRHDAGDEAMVTAAKIAFDLAMPLESTGSNLLATPDRDVYWVRRLYEKAVAGFYEVTLSDFGWSVQSGKHFQWQIESHSENLKSILPLMITDIILTNEEAGRRIVIDTKFNSILTQGRFREGVLRNGYVYQIYAYLMSQEGKGDSLADNATGLMLHPVVGDMLNEYVVMQNHEIRFATVDLRADAMTIRRQLLEVVIDSLLLNHVDGHYIDEISAAISPAYLASTIGPRRPTAHQNA